MRHCAQLDANTANPNYHNALVMLLEAADLIEQQQATIARLEAPFTLEERSRLSGENLSPLLAITIHGILQERKNAE